jgi:hypothetical protein
VPSPTSVVEPNVPVDVPPDKENVTAEPPFVTRFPATSNVVKITSILEPASTVALDKDTVEVAVETAPVKTIKLGGGLVSVVALNVAKTSTEVPAKAPVNVAVYMPFPA